MTRSADLSLADFTAALASLNPSLGGSCAAAVPAALAAALIAMVARQTTASDPFAELAYDMEPVAVEADELRAELLALAEEDIRAFERVMSARRAARSGEIQAAYRAAVEPPLRVCELSLRILELAVDVAERGHPYAAPDAGTAALFAAAALESAALSVQLELSPIYDEGFRAARVGEVARARDRACALRDSALAVVHEKLESPQARTRVVHG
ncbi:MAG TPA: cyclodeaminase/cyclohydrolase family protein [Myxococcota bacterium]|nr:cyclodeaminase/cyclohydrolase family protein [Myxococcota bacterium]